MVTRRFCCAWMEDGTAVTRAAATTSRHSARLAMIMWPSSKGWFRVAAGYGQSLDGARAACRLTAMTPDHARHARIGVDIGGTFTDLVWVDDATGAVQVGKLLTT